jgi:hypothetical protein
MRVMRAAGPLAPLYYSGQFVPLIVFFLLFLSIVKNNKLHHFVRFHCMQARAGLPDAAIPDDAE